MNAKQVIVMKKFPMNKNLRYGKYCSQSAHASVGALLSIADVENDKITISLKDPFVKEWILGNFKKIVLYVDTDEELIDIYNSAKLANLPASLIKDSGLTEFHGIPTLTSVGIGPANSDEIDKITNHLRLF